MARNNVYHLRPQVLTPSWRARLLVCVTYLLFAYEVPRIEGGTVINLVMLLAILYWAFVQQRKSAIPYFVRYHWLHALLLMAFVSVGLEIMKAAFIWIESGLLAFGGKHIATQVWDVVSGQLIFYLELGLKAGIFIVLSFAAGLGKSPFLPTITPQVRYWA